MRNSSFLKAIGVIGFGAILLSGQVALAMDVNKVYGGKKHKKGGDFGEHVEKKLHKNSWSLFGIKKPIKDSAPATLPGFRTPGQKAKEQVKLAKGLKVKYVTRNAARHADQFAFWPNDKNPKWLIFCIEIFPSNSLNTGNHPSVQRIRIRDGKVFTMLRGTLGCDGIRRTPWGTILATEEVSEGRAYEIFNPLKVNNHIVVDRENGVINDDKGNVSKKVIQRTTLPTMAWEGIVITEQGVLYAGDELTPGTFREPDQDGAALHKFIPTFPWNGKKAKDFDDSPFHSGNTYAARVFCSESRLNYGQGCEVGVADWVQTVATEARATSADNGSTGYYRPEDMDRDPLYTGPGVKICWMNTQRARAASFGEIPCAIDLEPFTAEEENRTVVINRFLEGNPDMNQPDNIAFQPYTGHVYVIEDNPNGDIFACLRDGDDENIKSDGCVKILSVRDSSAEPTGFKFDASGTTAYFSIQHSDDTFMPLVDSGQGIMFPTDDILKVTGFKIPKHYKKGK